jgi:tetratricopeptide (TPR) repeat protein
MSSSNNSEASGPSLLERIVRPVRALAFAIGVFGLSSSGCMPYSNYSVKPSPSSVCAKKQGNFTQKYCTNAHERLDMEKELMEEELRATGEYFEFLDRSVIDGVLREVGGAARFDGYSHFRNYRKDSARKFMNKIDRFFRGEGYKRIKSDVPLLSQALKTKTFDCDTAVSIYLALAEVLDLPLVAVREPEHIYLRWYFNDGTYLEWEPLEGEKKFLASTERRINDAYFKSRFKGEIRTAIKNGVYLADLTPQDILAMHYAFVSRAWRKKGNLEKAIELIDKAYSLSPKDPIICNNRGYAYLRIGDFDAAIENFNAALRSYPGFSKAYLNRGVAWFKKQDYNKSIEDFNMCIGLDSTNFKAFTNRGFAYLRLGHFDKALEDFDVSKDLQPNNFNAYYLSGFAWFRKGDYNKAVENFSKAFELNPDYTPALEAKEAVLKKKQEIRVKSKQKDELLTRAEFR